MLSVKSFDFAEFWIDDLEFSTKVGWVICKNFKDKERMRKAGRSAATVLERLCAFVQPGMSTLEIDEEGGRLMAEIGV